MNKTNETEDSDPAMEAAKQRVHLASYREQCPGVCAQYKHRALMNEAKAMLQFTLKIPSEKLVDELSPITDMANMEFITFESWVENVSQIKDRLSNLQGALDIIKRNTKNESSYNEASYIGSK